MYVHVYSILSLWILAMPIPIVAISAGIAHDQYGINDRWVTLDELMC